MRCDPCGKSRKVTRATSAGFQHQHTCVEELDRQMQPRPAPFLWVSRGGLGLHSRPVCQAARDTAKTEAMNSPAASTLWLLLWPGRGGQGVVWSFKENLFLSLGDGVTLIMWAASDPVTRATEV